MAPEATCKQLVNDEDEPGAGDWDNAARSLDEVALALFEGRYVDAIRLARAAARELRDAAGPEHPEHAKLDALAR
jgi:hypothetical protein